MRVRVYVGAVLFAWSAVVVGAQKVSTPEELDKVMKECRESQPGDAEGAGVRRVR